jgi:hypothetical protein
LSLKRIVFCFNVSAQISQLRFPEWERDDARFQATLRSFFAERAVAVGRQYVETQHLMNFREI